MSLRHHDPMNPHCPHRINPMLGCSCTRPTTTHDPYAGPTGTTCSCANCIHVSHQTLRGMEKHEPRDAMLMRNRSAGRFHPTTRNAVTLVEARP